MKATAFAFFNITRAERRNQRKARKMKNKIVTTNAKLSDGTAVIVKSTISVPTNLNELISLVELSLDTGDEALVRSHLTDLFVSWCVAHTYQSQVRNALKKASPTLTKEQLQKLIDAIPFRVSRPASAPRGDKVVLKKSQLTAEQIEKLKEMGIL